jgi:hypothetical protein
MTMDEFKCEEINFVLGWLQFKKTALNDLREFLKE